MPVPQSVVRSHLGVTSVMEGSLVPSGPTERDPASENACYLCANGYLSGVSLHESAQGPFQWRQPFVLPLQEMGWIGKHPAFLLQ